MKNKVSLLTRIVISFLGLALILNNCEKSTVSEEEVVSDFPQTKDKKDFIITSTSFSAKDNILENLRNNYSVDNHIRSLSTDGNTQSKTTVSKSTVVIDTSIVKKITQGDYTSYTMLIESLDDDPNTFYNITIEEFGDSTGMFVTQYKNFSNRNNHSLASRTNSISSSISTKRIDDLIKPIGKEDFGNENGGSSGGTGGGSGSGSYPMDCDGIVIVTQVAIPYQCLCNPRHWPWENCDCHTQPGYTYEDSFECAPISNIDGTGDIGGGTSGGGASGTGGSSIEPNTSLTTPIGDDDCKALNLTLNESYSIKSPFKVDLSDFYPTGCNNIDTSSVALNEKFMCIYNKLTESSKFKTLFIDMFGESENINVKFEIVDNIGTKPIPDQPIANAGTSGKIKPDGTVIELNSTIKINKNKLNLSALGIAQAIIHEAVHTFLQVKHINCNVGTPANEIFDELNNMTFSELLNTYYQDSCGSESQHEFMFDNMVPVISDILEEVLDSFVPQRHKDAAESEVFINERDPSGEPVPWNWDNFLFHMGLAGLQGTDSFKLDYPEDSSQLTNHNHYVNTGFLSFSSNCKN